MKRKNNYCPACCPICCITNRNYKVLQSILGFILGVLMGTGFYVFVLIDMDFGKIETVTLATLIIFLLSVGNLISDYVRCISLLMLPSAFGKTGRNVLKAFALSFILSGPIANLAINAKDVVRVFGCTTQLTYNLTKTKYQLLLKPFEQAFLNMRHDESIILNTLESVQDVVEPMVEEIEGQEEVDRIKAKTDFIDSVEGDSPRSKEIERKYKELKEKRRAASNGTIPEGEFYEMEYKRKIEYRCQGVINEGTSKCQDLFKNAYDSCYDKVGIAVAWMLCWPMKITFMCNLATVFGGSSLCDANKIVEPGFGDGYSTVKHAKEMMSSNLGDVKLKFVMTGDLPEVDAQGIVESADVALDEINKNKIWLDYISTTLKRLFAIAFIFIANRAAEYQDKYLNDLNFDNKYITSYFKKLEVRQIQADHQYLFPLKKKEMEYFIDPYSILLDKSEIWKIIKLSLLSLIEVLPVLTMFALDLLLTEMLEIIRDKAQVEFTQNGEYHMDIKVHGVGFIANLVRSLVRNMNVHENVHVVHSNLTCLPRPSRLSSYFIIKISAIYLAVWILIIADGYTTRLNRLISSHFYPKREKRRILYLYNETLKRRARQLFEIKNNILNIAIESKRKMELNIFLSLRFKYSRFFSWLHWFSFARRECLVCCEIEPFENTKKFVYCSTPNCLAVYCLQCWGDVDQFCYNCQISPEQVEYDEENYEEETSDADP